MLKSLKKIWRRCRLAGPSRSPHLESLMAVDARGHLVLDQAALLASGRMDRQYEAANRLCQLLKAGPLPPKPFIPNLSRQ